MVVAVLAGAITITDAANNYNAAVAAFVAGVAAVAAITDAASKNTSCESRLGSLHWIDADWSE